SNTLVSIDSITEQHSADCSICDSTNSSISSNSCFTFLQHFPAALPCASSFALITAQHSASLSINPCNKLVNPQIGSSVTLLQSSHAVGMHSRGARDIF